MDGALMQIVQQHCNGIVKERSKIFCQSLEQGHDDAEDCYNRLTLTNLSSDTSSEEE